MAGIKGQGKVQKEILVALETSPILSLRSLNPDGNRSRKRSLRRSAGKLLAASLLVRVKIVVPAFPIPLVHDCWAKSGSYTLGVPTVSQTEAEPEPEPVPEPEISERREPMNLNERINRLQEKLNS